MIPVSLYPGVRLLASGQTHYCVIIIYDFLETQILVHSSGKGKNSLLDFSFLTRVAGNTFMETAPSI